MKKNQSDYYIESIKRAIKIINTLSCEKEELGITEISKRLNLHKSTVHRILITLASENVIIKNLESNKYRLGITLFSWGSVVKQNMGLRKNALPIMKDLAQKTQETIYLNIITGWKRMSIEKIESSNPVKRSIKLGEYLPLYTGGSGKALLAYMPDEVIKDFIQEEKLISFTPNTITNPEKLLRELREIRKKGYAIGREERVIGATAIGAPVFNYTNKVIASLTISGPVERFNEEKISIFAPLVKEAAMKLSVSLGYQL